MRIERTRAPTRQNLTRHTEAAFEGGPRVHAMHANSSSEYMSSSTEVMSSEAISNGDPLEVVQDAAEASTALLATTRA